MKQFLSLFTLLWVLSAGSAFSSAIWPNEPAGATLLNDWGHGALTGGGWSDAYKGWTSSITTDATAPVSPSTVLQQRFANGLEGGMGGGGGSGFFTTGLPFPGSPELYWGFSMKLDANYENHPVGTKIGWMHGNISEGKYAGSQQTNNFFILMVGSNPYNVTMNYQQDNIDNSHFANVGTIRLDPFAGSFRAGEWVKLEFYMKKSTTPTSRDGIIRWWVNGVLAGNCTIVNTDQIFFGSVSHVTIWGGMGSVKTRDSFIWFDHEHVSLPHGAPSILMISSSLPSPRTGTPYSGALAASDGKAPYTWFLESGKLPAGLSLNAGTGIISGTPACVGRSDFTIRVTDSNQPALTATKSFSLVTSGTGVCQAAINSGFDARSEQAQFLAKAANGNVTFNLPVTTAEQYRLSIFDLSGKNVYAHQSMGQRETSITKALKNGVYLARFMQGGQSSTVRFHVMN